MFSLFVTFADGSELVSQPVMGTELQLAQGAAAMASFQECIGKEVIDFGFRPIKK